MIALFIRHGETDWNHEGRMQGRTDTPLNALGREQAERLASRLVQEPPIDELYCSPLARAFETAAIIGQALGLEPRTDVRLVERSAGQLEGLTLADIEREYPAVFRAWRDDKSRPSLPGAEEQQAFQSRVVLFLQMLTTRPVGRIAVVTHGGTLSMVFATLMGLDIQSRFPFRFDNTSLSKVDLDGRPRIELLNDSSHLRPARLPSPSAPCPDPATEPEFADTSPAPLDPVTLAARSEVG